MEINVPIGMRNETNDFEGDSKHQKSMFMTVFTTVLMVLLSLCSQTVVNSSKNETHARQVM